MKVILVIGCILSAGLSFSQEWRDSLEVARSEYKKGNYKKALRYYKSAQKKAPEDIDLSDEIGQSAYRSEDYETAEKVLQQNGGNKSTARAKAKNYHNIGNSRMRSKNYEGAVEAYKESLRLNPKDEKTRYNLSEATRKLRKEEKEKKQNESNQDNKKSDDKSQEKPGDKGESKGEKKNDGKKNSQPKDNKKNSKNQKNQGKKSDNNKSQLPNKSVERMLDELVKSEAETKKKMAGNGGGSYTPQSGKDW